MVQLSTTQTLHKIDNVHNYMCLSSSVIAVVVVELTKVKRHDDGLFVQGCRSDRGWYSSKLSRELGEVAASPKSCRSLSSINEVASIVVMVMDDAKDEDHV